MNAIWNKDMECMPRRDLETLQLERLKALVDYCDRNVEFYHKRLETAGCLITFTQEHNGRLRKYYAITDEGRRRITAFLEEWDELRSVYAFIQNGGVAPQPLPGAGLPQTPAPSNSTGKDLESS